MKPLGRTSFSNIITYTFYKGYLYFKYLSWEKCTKKTILGYLIHGLKSKLLLSNLFSSKHYVKILA